MRAVAARIAGWTKNSFIDFPGTVSTVLFFSGCNLRCPYCHNPGIALGETPEDVPFLAVMEFLEKRRGVVEGVVLSGGEPTLQKDLAEVAEIIRSKGFKIKLDTNGLLPEAIQAVAPDYLALDVKTLPASYNRLLKAPYDDVQARLLKALAMVKSMNENAEIRITAAPGIVDTKVIEELGRLISGVRKVFIQPMQTRAELLDPTIKEKKPISQEELEEYRKILSGFAGKCEIRGSNK